MKLFCRIALAAGFAFAAVASAQAGQPIIDLYADSETVDTPVAGHPHHPCHGQASGTSHASCGTATGGPSGGLF